jgi:hypothetical protein
MIIDMSKLDYAFQSKPLLIGGKAMEFYGLRQAGADIDFVITPQDYACLAQKYPGYLRDLWGDLGVCVYEFEIWKSICLFEYDFLSDGACDAGEFRVISLEKLLFLKALAMKIEKYHHDLELVVKKILDDQWSHLSPEVQAHYLAKK